MMNLYDEKPIIACSTGTTSNTAIGLIRISGFIDLDYIQEFISIPVEKIKVRFAHYCSLLDKNKNELDSIVLTYYKGPNSYNGENIIEFGVHGNQFNISKILNTFIDSGKFRHAKEGEFTLRALLNKKLTLSQVEGLDLLLNANSGLMLQQGLETLQGNLHNEYTALYDSFMHLKSGVELSIDFSEDVGDDQISEMLQRATKDFSSKISGLNRRIQSNTSSLTSPSVVLVGQTNAGKSSLFNKLLDDNRSIVSSTAGTTRDYVSEYIQFDDVNYRLVDTAGIRETVDNIEQIGIERTFDVLDKSFYKILVVNPFETNFEDFKKLPSDVVFDLLIVTNKDREEVNVNELLEKLPKFDQCFHLSLKENIGPIEPVEYGPIEPESESGPMGPVKYGPIEPVTKSGPIEPAILVTELISSKFNDLTKDNPILIDRHRDCINKISLKTKEFQVLMENEADIAIISSELNILGSYVSELIGIISPDDVLNNIFSNFCIGK